MSPSPPPQRARPACGLLREAGRRVPDAIAAPGRHVRTTILAVVLGLAFATLAAGDNRPVKLLAFGDSLIHGYGLPAEETFPAQLQVALAAEGLEVEVINGGNSGDTSAAGRARLDWALADAPDIVLITFGGNDFLRGIDPKDTYRNLDAILRRLRDDGAAVLLTGMIAPRNLGRDFAAEFDAIYPALAETYDVSFYPFFLDGVAARPDLNQADGIHPNAAGVAVIVAKILPALRPLVEAAAAERSGDG